MNALQAWVGDKSKSLDNALTYYLGPTGIPDKLNALGNLLWYSDAGDYREAVDASKAVWNDPSFGNALRYATAGAALAVPFVGAKMAQDGTNVLADAGEELRKFWVDEDGAVRLYGGKSADMTNTEWTFKNADYGLNRDLTAADNKRFSNYTGVDEATLPIRSLRATQPSVNPDFMTTESSSGELPFVVRKNGKLYVKDGHHRIVRASEQGAQNVRVRFMDFDSVDNSLPLFEHKTVSRDEIDQLLKYLGVGE